MMIMKSRRKNLKTKKLEIDLNSNDGVASFELLTSVMQECSTR